MGIPRGVLHNAGFYSWVENGDRETVSRFDTEDNLTKVPISDGQQYYFLCWASEWGKATWRERSRAMIIKSAVGEVFLREVAYPYGLESIGKQFMSAELAHYGTQNCRIPIDKTWVEDIRRNYKNISRAAELRISESGSKKIVFEFHFDSTPGLERRMKSQTGSTKGNSSRVSHQSSTGPYLTASEDDKQKQRADREARAKKRASSDRESAQSETREERATRRAGEKARAEVLDSGSDSNTPLDESDDVQEDDEENDEKGDERDIESPLSDIPESRARTVDLVNNSEIKAEGSPPDEPPTAPPSSQTPSMEDIEQSSEKSSSGRAGTSGNEEVSKRKRDDSESEADGEIDIYALLRRKNELEQAKAARATNKMRREKLNQKCHKLTQKVQKRVRILENEQNDSLEKENEAQLLEEKTLEDISMLERALLASGSSCDRVGVEDSSDSD